MNVNEIINFIISKDIYYYNPNFKNHNNRDPKIFQYIPITDIDNNYLYNITLIKKNNLWNLFSESNISLRKKFYEILLDQIKKLEDIESIFLIFPIKDIDKDLTLLLNQKIYNIKYSILDKKDKTYGLYFSIFDKWLICNDNNNLDLKYIAELLKINYEITSKYFFYLLKNKDMNYIVLKIKKIIINFCLEIQKDKTNAEAFCSLLLLSKDINKLNLDILNEMNKNILTEKDFYKKKRKSKFFNF